MMDKIKKFFGRNRKIVLVGVVALIVVVIAAVLASGTFESIDENYFVSDGGKLVMSLTKDQSNYEMSEYEPGLTHVVYYYGGNSINNMRIFYEYDNEEEAREANEHISMDDKDWATGRKLHGKYIIFEVPKKRWENLSLDYIRGVVENMNELKNR